MRPARSLRVTIVAANPFEFDSRFLRTALTLAEDGHDVTVLATAAPGLPAEETLGPRVRLVRLDLEHPISAALRPLPAPVRGIISEALGLDPGAAVLPAEEPHGLDRLRHPLRRLLEIIASIRRAGPWTDEVVRVTPDADVVHCQSLVVLPVAHAAARRLGARFVYDVADYHIGTERLARMPWLVRELVRRRERALARQASGFLAVSDPVADLVARRWSVPRPAVLLNCPPAWRPDEPAPRGTVLRRTIEVPDSRPLILYQGGFSIDRGLEELVAAVGRPELRAIDAAVVFLGYGRLRDGLEDAARAHPGRVFVLPAVPPDTLLDWTSGADVAFIGQPARTLNWQINLPNKLFESLMAGIPVLVSEDSEQCRLVSSEGVGACVVMEPEAIARAIAAMLAPSDKERTRLSRRCRSIALERYTWERNAGGLVDLYRRLAEPTQGVKRG